MRCFANNAPLLENFSVVSSPSHRRREARTRVRARAACAVCVCVQYGTSEIVLSESPPPAFPRFSCPEMNARPRAADSETRFHCADVTSALVNVHASLKRHQHASSLATAHRCGARTRSRSRPSRGRYDSRPIRVLKRRGGRCVSPVYFVRGLVLALSLALLRRRRTAARSSDCRVGS